MDVKKWLLTGLMLGVVANVLDFLVHGTLLAWTYASHPVFSQENRIVWLVLGDFVAALVFSWAYLRFAGSVPLGSWGGVVFGFYVGVLVNFPTNIFVHLLIAGFPYHVSWIWTVYGVIRYVVLGAIAGALNKS